MYITVNEWDNFEVHACRKVTNYFISLKKAQFGLGCGSGSAGLDPKHCEFIVWIHGCMLCCLLAS
jgi:hypothetical protein